MGILQSLPLIKEIIGLIVTVVEKTKQFFSQKSPDIPRKTIRVVPHPFENRWSQGTSGGKPAIHLTSHWYVTNISNRDVLLCGVRLKRPKISGGILVRLPESKIYGTYRIPSKWTTDAIVNFCIQPPPRKEHKTLIVTINFIDQFGNFHRVRRVKFFPPAKRTKEESPPLEPVSEISNPVEREVVGVLQAELSRYKACGRSVGGLGSIKTTYRDKSFTGVGSWSVSSDSPDQQDIVTDPENAKIESDNASSLIDYYATLNGQQQNDFVKSCLDRLSREKPYASIGYFILFVLYRNGHLKKALEKAKRDLQGDSAYGFSDLLILLNGLLRFEHPNFLKEMLDESEQFLSGIKEHTFRISERIAAIRSIKLAESIKGTDEEKKS